MTKLLVMLRVKFKDLQKIFLFRIRRRKRPDVNICSQSGDIKPRIAKNRPKIDQNLWMIRKIFVKIFWLKRFQMVQFKNLSCQKWNLKTFKKFFSLGGQVDRSRSWGQVPTGTLQLKSADLLEEKVWLNFFKVSLTLYSRYFEKRLI